MAEYVSGRLVLESPSGLSDAEIRLLPTMPLHAITSVLRGGRAGAAAADRDQPRSRPRTGPGSTARARSCPWCTRATGGSASRTPITRCG